MQRTILSHCKNHHSVHCLIDDLPNNGANDFTGEWIHFGSEQFPDWGRLLSASFEGLSFRSAFLSYLTFLLLAPTHDKRIGACRNIVFIPQWHPIPQSDVARFTLIFSGLPKGCTHFNLVEIINEPGGWLMKDSKRNAQDVYQVA